MATPPAGKDKQSAQDKTAAKDAAPKDKATAKDAAPKDKAASKDKASRAGAKTARRPRIAEWSDTFLSQRPVVQYGLAAILVLAVALLVGPALTAPESLLKQLTVGAPAPKSIKSTRNFVVPPSDKVLERRRRRAAEKVLPVFDHQADRSASLLARVNRAFEAMAVPELPATAEGEPKPPPVEPPAEEMRIKFAAALQSDVDPDVFRRFRRVKFSADLRAAFVVLIGSAMEQLLVAHRSELTPFKGRPIVVRHLIAGRVSDRGEERLESFNRIRDLAQVREQIAHQANVHGAKFSAKLRRALVQQVESLIVTNVNLSFNLAETTRRRQLARDSIHAEPRAIVTGEVIIRDGTPVQPEHRRIVAQMEAGYKVVSQAQVTLIGVGLLVSILLLVVHRFASRHLGRLRLSTHDILTLGVLTLAVLALTRGAMVLSGEPGPGQTPVFPYLLPVAAGAMLVRLLIGPETAALFAVVIAALCGLALEKTGGLGISLFYLVTGLVGAAGMAQVQSRSTILRAGLLCGTVGAIAALCLGLSQGEVDFGDLVSAALAALAGGVCASFATLALLPALEWLFGYTTDVTLLELANLNHPLLRELMLRAPGTYHHSMVVGNLSEMACEAIGANPLLVHVACNFHDVGKMKNSPYFAENFKDADNPHNRLKPSMSALIIRSHVKDTIEMLRDHGIPELVIDTATQHHGTTRMEFFFHKACDQKESDEEIHEEDYRYPGPKPQSREAGVLMLADGVEAAARSLAEPTEDRLRAVVQRVINTKFTDGQLDHCDLTLRDLHLIAKAFLQVLRGIYHQRPTYPWQRPDETREDARRVREDRTTRRRRRPEKSDKSERADPTGEQQAEPPATQGQGKAKERDSEAKDAGGGAVAEDQSAGEGRGKGHSQPSSPDEDSTAGSSDIKRLGLN